MMPTWKALAGNCRVEQPCEAVFFDFGYTLAFNNRHFVDSLRCAVAAAGIEVNAEALRGAVRRADRELRPERLLARGDRAYHAFRVRYYAYVLGLLGVPDPEDATARWLQDVIDLYHGVYLKPETRTILPVLTQAGLTLGVVSNFSHALPGILKALGIRDFFDFVTYSDDVGYDKPSPRIFEDALSKAGGIPPARILHVGDSYGDDVLGARNVGITGVLLETDGTEAEADCPRIRNLLELADLLGLPHPLTPPAQRAERG